MAHATKRCHVCDSGTSESWPNLDPLPASLCNNALITRQQGSDSGYPFCSVVLNVLMHVENARKEKYADTAPLRLPMVLESIQTELVQKRGKVLLDIKASILYQVEE